MISWIELAISLNNPLNFSEFKQAALEKEVAHAFTLSDYSCRVGRTLAYLLEYPNTDINHAYYISNGITITSNGDGATPTNVTVSCCGGGSSL